MYLYFACVFIRCLKNQGTRTGDSGTTLPCPVLPHPAAKTPIDQWSAIFFLLLAFRSGLGILQPRDLHLLELFRNPSQYSPSQQSQVSPSRWLGWCSSGGTCIWDL